MGTIANWHNEVRHTTHTLIVLILTPSLFRIGGNANARQYFRKHGFTDLYGGKTDKKYSCKAATSYKVELSKQVKDESAKRDGITSPNDITAPSTNLLENLSITDQKKEQDDARLKQADDRAQNNKTTNSYTQAIQKLASQITSAQS